MDRVTRDSVCGIIASSFPVQGFFTEDRMHAYEEKRKGVKAVAQRTSLSYGREVHRSGKKAITRKSHVTAMGNEGSFYHTVSSLKVRSSTYRSDNLLMSLMRCADLSSCFLQRSSVLHFSMKVHPSVPAD